VGRRVASGVPLATRRPTPRALLAYQRNRSDALLAQHELQVAGVLLLNHEDVFESPA